MGNNLRLDKYLADAGVGTRSEVKRYLKAGRITLDGSVIKDPAAKVDSDSAVVTFDGNAVHYEKYLYYMLNKPAGCVSATKDKLSDTVLSFLEGEPTRDLFPVGRLDKDTEGLLIITNDGEFAHNLLAPKKHVYKTYQATVDKKISDTDMEAFATGIDIGDEKLCLPAKIKLISEAPIVYELQICEGRFHQVKRMFEACGSTVTYLKRTAFGEWSLDENLLPGQYRRL